jgi:hypothetical protein
MNAQPDDPDRLDLGAIPMPRLSDDAVIQIHDFIHHVLDLFEARYGDQIHRFYQDLCTDPQVEPYSNLTPHDPPF